MRLTQVGVWLPDLAALFVTHHHSDHVVGVQDVVLTRWVIDHRRFVLDYHADTRLIGRQAAELGVGTLVLTHLIPPPDAAGDADAFVADVRSGGSGEDYPPEGLS